MSQFKGANETVKSSTHNSLSLLALSKAADKQQPYFTSMWLSAKHHMIAMVMHPDPQFS